MADGIFFGGINVVVSPDSPKMRLSESVTVSDEFRSAMNAWMEEFFGFDNIIEDGQVIGMPGGNKVFMNPRTFEQVKLAMKHKEAK